MTEEKTCNCEYWRKIARGVFPEYSACAVSFCCPQHGAATIDFRQIPAVAHKASPPPLYRRPDLILVRPRGPADNRHISRFDLGC